MFIIIIILSSKNIIKVKEIAIVKAQRCWGVYLCVMSNVKVLFIEQVQYQFAHF